ncbi:endo alpha-1,4 polygalactosaminidase [Kineosporia rhizophila]|uniref:endo alpha-1,4 polygalactosaminidase n=1 Tax=Kineosporia rhizophila TaxID=84633 RepID=UPI000A56476C|nr:endo alpha-1,4 polygalactosaminidase [Kineosporia rhizophila]MCE0538753.1 endo alpha-1,4 polygalactosaminidase [Kineosporia rhizophila]
MSNKRTHRRRILVASAAGLVLLLGVGSYATASAANPWRDRGGRGAERPTPVQTTTPAATAAADTEVTLPPANGQFDYQIGGAYTPVAAVKIVDRDREAKPASGKYNICYVNAFQTQPSEADFWTGSHDDLLLKTADGDYVEDSEWGEFLLDTSTEAKRKALAAVVGEWIDGCAAAGFDAVEPDNLDTYTRSDDLLSKDDNVAFAALLAERAHDAGLAIAQKNTAELDQSDAKAAGFDFAIAEECQVWKECDAYTDIYGDQVYEIEYTDNGQAAYTKACASQGKEISVILRDRKVVPSGKSAYRYQSC